jgi:hypothetical protein
VVKTAALFFHKQNQQAVAKQQLVLYAGWSTKGGESQILGSCGGSYILFCFVLLALAVAMFDVMHAVKLLGTVVVCSGNRLPWWSYAWAWVYR